MARGIIGFFILLGLTACSQSAEPLRTAEHNNVWLAGQPTAEDFQVWADAGRTVIINIRPDDEIAQLSFDPAEAALEAGVTYVQFGVGGSEGFTTGMTAALTFQLNMHEEENVVIHCASGNRAAHIYAAHLIQTGQVAPEGADDLGLTPNGELDPAIMRQLSTDYAAAFPE